MAGPPPPPPLAPAPPPQPNPSYEEWILDTIDSLRSRKARPDLERICRMVRRRHGPEPERTRQELERLIQRRAVLRVSYKGSISYRNAARVQPPRGRRGAAGGQQQPPPSEQQRETPILTADLEPPRSRTAEGDWQQWARVAEHETPLRNRSKGPGAEEVVECEPRDGGFAEREAPHSRGLDSGDLNKEGECTKLEVPRNHSGEPEPLPRSRSRCRGQTSEGPEPRTRNAVRRPPPGRGNSERLTRGRAREQRRLQRIRGSPAPRERSMGRTSARPPRTKKTEQSEEEEVSVLSEGSEVPDDEEEEARHVVEEDKVANVTSETIIKQEYPQEMKPTVPCRMNGDFCQDDEKDGPCMGEASRCTGDSKSCQDSFSERGIGTCHPLKSASKEQFNSNSCPPEESIMGGTFARAMEETASRDSIAHPPDPTTATDFPLEVDKIERGTKEQRKSEDSGNIGAYPRAFMPLSPGKSVMQRVDGISYHNSTLKKEKLLDPVEWTVTDVVDYFTEAGFGDQASAFKEQEIDGKSLLLMQRTDVLTGLSIRLGPALKIYEYHIKVLQQCHFEEDEGDCFLG